MIEFILRHVPLALFVYDSSLNIVFANMRAQQFFRHHTLPPEVSTVSRRMIDAVASGSFSREFPGEVLIHGRLADPVVSWTFHLVVDQVSDPPLVCVYCVEQGGPLSMDLNAARQQYHLTRRETDVLRRLLHGMKNMDIAEDLNIAEQTVKDHLSNIYQKTGTENRFGLIRLLSPQWAERS